MDSKAEKRKKKYFKDLELQTSSESKSYYYLSFVIGIGVLVSILLFIVSIGHNRSLQEVDYLSSVNNYHRIIESEILTQRLHLDIIKDLVLDSDQNLDHLNLGWLEKRVNQTKFDCLFLVKWDVRQKRQIYNGEKFDSMSCKGMNVQFSEIKNKNRLGGIHIVSSQDDKKTYLIFSHYLSRIGNQVDAYLIGFLPLYRIQQPEVNQYDISFAISRLKNKNKSIKKDTVRTMSAEKSSLERILYIYGQSFVVQYNIDSKKIGAIMFWPLVTLLLGFFLTAIISSLYFQLLVHSSETERLVEERTKDLNLAIDQAKKANDTKSRFLANVSHDVRTPLNLILGMSSLLHETQMSVEQKEYLSSMERAGNHLLDLVNGILDIARIESGEIISTSEKVDFPDLLSSISKIVSIDCRRKKLNFSLNIGVGVPKIVNVDPKLIRQILINLLYNAIKFTKEGTINLTVEAENISSGKAHLIFKVSDTGDGIAEKDIERIFQAFEKGEKNNKMGVGLGLSIVKTLVKHLEGNVKVKSILGQGSVFTVDIPVEVESDEKWLESIKSELPYLANKKVLLFCHTEVKFRFLRNAFQYLNCDVVAFNETSATMKEIEQNCKEYDFIVLDLVGKDLGAVDLLKNADIEKNQLKKFFVLCPVVHRSSDIVFFEDFGISNIVFEPVDFRSLARLITSKIDDQAEVSSITDPTQTKSTLAPLKDEISLLVAEDDVDNRQLIAMYLKNQNVKIYFAEDGEVGLHEYRDGPEGFDIILTDIQMPNMDGYEFIKAVRDFEQKNNKRSVPIVVVTADAQSEQIDHLKAIGATEYLTKPLSKNKLIKILAKYCGQIDSPEMFH